MFLQKQFWNQKILSWEQNKYDKKHYLLDVNSSVKQRISLATSVIQQISKGNNLLELACGSGRLWDEIHQFNLSHYTGVDFSDVAIKAFQEKTSHKNPNVKIKKTSLFCEDCLEKIYSADIVVSLGLLDWLSIDQIKKLAENYKNTMYLHSFSEKKLSLSQMIHFLYVFINYGYKTKFYVPQYYKANELLSIFGNQAKIYRNPKLNFGAFIYHLPNHVHFKI